MLPRALDKISRDVLDHPHQFGPVGLAALLDLIEGRNRAKSSSLPHVPTTSDVNAFPLCKNCRMSSWPVVVPVIVSASVALIVSVLTPAFTALQGRRDEIHAKFDRALSSLLTVQVARHIVTSIARSYHPGDDEQYRRFNVSMAEDSIRRFVEQTVRAREALSELAAYVPEVREWIAAGWELTEEREPEQRQQIELRRADAVKQERLIRSRRR